MDVKPQPHRLIWTLGGLAAVVIAMLGLSLVLARAPQHATTVLSVQLALVAVAAGLIAYARQCLSQCLLTPLGILREWAARLTAGDFSARLPARRETAAFAGLFEDGNKLGESLETLSRNMRGEVEKQTRRLEQKTRALRLLYDVSASVNVARDVNGVLRRLLPALTEIMQARAASLRRLDAEERMVLAVAVGFNPALERLDAELPAPKPPERGEIIQTQSADGWRVVSVPLQYRNRVYGTLRLFVEPGRLPEREDYTDLLTSVGRYMGMAIERAGIDEEADRLSRMEERHRLANELHDSLAQTLASLRFQVRVLDETLHQGEESQVWQELERVENSLDEAYRELRELIAQFRAPPQHQGVVPSLQAVVDRLRSEGQMLVFLQNEWGNAQLPAEVESQVVRIVQEALTNARKHAQARAVRVLLRNAGGGNYHVLIEDDGVGIAELKGPQRPGEHIGLDIMQERARRIGGELKIESEANEGTTVTLNFRYPPAEAPARAAAMRS